MNLKTCVFLVASLVAAPALATPIPVISVAPVNATFQVGDEFDVNVSIADAVNLITFGFDLTFDSSVIEPIGDPTLGPFLEKDGGQIDVFFPGFSDPGSLTFIFATLADPGTASGTGILATIAFRAVGAGATALTLTPDQIILIDNTSDPFFPENIDFTSENGSVTVAQSTDVTPVPEPATVVLVGSGLAGAWRKHRARKRK